MLQGGLRSPLPLRLVHCETQSPFCTLLAMANPTHQSEDVILENGLLSYENPNYHLDPARFDDALNSNDSTAAFYEEFCHKLDSVCNQQQQQPENHRSRICSVGSRKRYAALDLGAMGVDVNTGPACALFTFNSDNRVRSELDNMGRTGMQYSASPDKMQFLNDEAVELSGSNSKVKYHSRDSISEKSMDLSSPEDCEHIDYLHSNEILKLPLMHYDRCSDEDFPLMNIQDGSLPHGWERHEDNDGPYYWHIKSGTIQREIPNDQRRQANSESSDVIQNSDAVSCVSFACGVPRSSTSSALEDLQDRGKRREERREETAFKRRSYPTQAEPDSTERAIRYAVRSLGWVEIPEEDLTPERSSRAVNRCIVDLSLGRNDLLDVVGRWGDGKDLFMDLDEGALKLIDPENLTVLNTQPIHTIRVWGVGRDNGRDFAYVARDRVSRKHMCHVFRCDIPARTIANTLRDICKKIMIERSVQQNTTKPSEPSTAGKSERAGFAVRPTNLPTEQRRIHVRNGQSIPSQSFPTPMEEPKKMLRAQYLGSMQVSRASGMDIINDAIDEMKALVARSDWKHVNVAVAPSMISILHPGEEEHLVAECRVRYLSFLGIGRDVQQCAFIMHTAQDLFIAHVFHCEPSSGALCKTIEAACKLRYQKCLDAHPAGLSARSSADSSTSGRGLGATLKSLVGSLTGRKSNMPHSQS